MASGSDVFLSEFSSVELVSNVMSFFAQLLNWSSSLWNLLFHTSNSHIRSSFTFSSCDISSCSLFLVFYNSSAYLYNSSTRYSFSVFQSVLALSLRIISWLIFLHRFLFISFSSLIMCFWFFTFSNAYCNNCPHLSWFSLRGDSSSVVLGLSFLFL